MAAQALTDPEWDDIINAIRDKSECEAGEVLAKRVREFLLDLAAQDVINRLNADNKISIDELADLI